MLARESHGVGGDDAVEKIATPEGKRRYVRSLFATIADRYDAITIALSYGQDRRWKRRLVRLGASSLDLELMCWIATTNADEFATP